MSAANCFIVLAADQGSVEPGDPVTVEPFHGLL
jgi:molybdopterin molybdotransferase